MYRIAKFSMFRGRRRSSPFVSPSKLLLEWITRVCIYIYIYTSVVRFERVNWGGAQVQVTAPLFGIDGRHNCIAISWKRSPLVNWSIHVSFSSRVCTIFGITKERFIFNDFILKMIINYLVNKRNNSVYIFFLISMLGCFKCLKLQIRIKVSVYIYICN